MKIILSFLTLLTIPLANAGPCVEIYDGVKIGCPLENKETFEVSGPNEQGIVMYHKTLNINDIHTKILVYEFKGKTEGFSLTENFKAYRVYRNIEASLLTTEDHTNSIETLDKKWGKHIIYNDCQEILKIKEFCDSSEKNTWFPKDSIIHIITLDHDGTINYATKTFQKLKYDAMKQQIQMLKVFSNDFK